MPIWNMKYESNNYLTLFIVTLWWLMFIMSVWMSSAVNMMMGTWAGATLIWNGNREIIDDPIVQQVACATGLNKKQGGGADTAAADTRGRSELLYMKWRRKVEMMLSCKVSLAMHNAFFRATRIPLRRCSSAFLCYICSGLPLPLKKLRQTYSTSMATSARGRGYDKKFLRLCTVFQLH